MDPGFGQRQKNSRQQPERNQQSANATFTEVIDDKDDDDIGAASSGTSGAKSVSNASETYEQYNLFNPNPHWLPLLKVLESNTISPAIETKFSSGSASHCTSSSTKSVSGSASSAVTIIGHKSYAEVLLSEGDEVHKETSTPAIKLEEKPPQLCEICKKYDLDQTDEYQRLKHIHECIIPHKKALKAQFNIANSRDKQCSICLDVIIEKTEPKNRFGILPNCNHVFCLDCISKWRQSKQYRTDITRACPECRTKSNFVNPSRYWVDTKEDKQKMLIGYKSFMSKKDCKHFAKGKGKCPFGNECFYKHALEDGQLVDVGVSRKRNIYQPRSDDNLGLNEVSLQRNL